MGAIDLKLHELYAAMNTRGFNLTFIEEYDGTYIIFEKDSVKTKIKREHTNDVPNSVIITKIVSEYLRLKAQ